MVEERGGWYVVNVKDARWVNRPTFGKLCIFEKEGESYPDFGANLFILEPGKPNCRYHRESRQEGFLVLSGRCLLLVNGAEQPLEAWDYVHCPAVVSHVLVGAGDGPCVVLAIGARPADLYYPHNETARRHGAQAPEATDDPRVCTRVVQSSLLSPLSIVPGVPSCACVCFQPAVSTCRASSPVSSVAARIPWPMSAPSPAPEPVLT